MTLIISLLLFGQLPPPSCARGEKVERTERLGRVEVVCSIHGQRVRRVASERGVRSVDDLRGFFREEFLESTGQRLGRYSHFTARTDEPDQTWWPDGCLLSSKSWRHGEVFFAGCARSRGAVPDGGALDQVVVIPPAIASSPSVDRLAELGLLIDRTPDGGVRVCLSDAGPCEVTAGQALVLLGEQQVIVAAPSQVMLLDRARRSSVPLPDDVTTRILGGAELVLKDGGTIDVTNGARASLGCEGPVRRLADHSVLCWEWGKRNGYLRLWKGRERFCPAENVRATLIKDGSGLGLGPSVLQLVRTPDPQCLEVFDGLLDWIGPPRRGHSLRP